MATEAERVALREFLRCHDDAWYFVSRYCYTLDPEAPDGVERIRLVEPFDFAKEITYLLSEFSNMHGLKSRRMLLTTLASAVLLWGITFVEGFSALTISRKDTLVDDGGSNSTWNSIHGKIRFMWERLPDHVRMPLQFANMRITNPAKESYIIGESGNVTDAGRAGAFTVALMDEAAKLPWSEALFGSIRPNCKAIWMLSTPAGKSGVFYRIHKAQSTDFTRIRLHWRQHPNRDERWYAQQCMDMTPEQIAEELDCSFSGSVRGKCIPEFDYDKHVHGRAVYDSRLPLYAGWDFGIGAPSAVVFSQHNGMEWRVIGAMQADNLNVPDFGNVAWGYIQSRGYTGTRKQIECWGDPAGAARQFGTGHTVFQDYATEGWTILPATSMRYPTAWIASLRKEISKGRWVCNPDCVELIDCLENMRYPTDKDGKALTTEAPDPRAHEFTHLPAAHGYQLGTTCEYVGADIGFARMLL